MKLKALKKQLQELKQQVVDLEMPIPGSIQIMFLRCGKKNCHCHQSDEFRHGPYYLWYRRIHGKMTTQSIAEEDVQSFKKWISNREILEKLVHEMISVGQNYATIFKSRSRKLKKTSTPMCGK
jgi:hypothetical protein